MNKYQQRLWDALKYNLPTEIELCLLERVHEQDERIDELERKFTKAINQNYGKLDALDSR